MGAGDNTELPETQKGSPLPKAPVWQAAVGSMFPRLLCIVEAAGGVRVVAYTSSPMRVTLAERKVCSTKTMGLGQECRSSACARKGRMVSKHKGNPSPRVRLG